MHYGAVTPERVTDMEMYTAVIEPVVGGGYVIKGDEVSDQYIFWEHIFESRREAVDWLRSRYYLRDTLKVIVHTHYLSPAGRVMPLKVRER